MDLTLIHLAGRNMTGKGVRMRELSINEANDIALKAAEVVGANSAPGAYRAQELRMSLLASIHSYTTKGYKTPDELNALPKEAWKKFDVAEIETDETGKKLDAIFSRKEWEAVAAWYQRNNEVNQKELEDIEGKALRVSVD